MEQAIILFFFLHSVMVEVQLSLLKTCAFLVFQDVKIQIVV